MSKRSWLLDHGWRVRQADGDGEWLRVSKVPTNIHVDLLAAKKIQDPFLGINELRCSWVNEKAWIYQISLPKVSRPTPQSNSTYALSFKGLDTIATVRLNGEVILKSDNMFLSHRVDVTKSLSYDGTNVLEIEFASAFNEARRIKAEHPNHKWICWNGEPARLAVRKAQYHWGWDWGPILSPCGPWRPIRLQRYDGRISDLRIDYDLDADLTAASLTIRASVESCPSGAEVEFQIREAPSRICPSGAHRSTIRATVNDGNAVATVDLSNIKVWWPRGYGDQVIYQVFANLVHETKSLHRVVRSTGFRKCELVREKDGSGESFFFRINNVDVFCGGSNWIPGDSFLSRFAETELPKWKDKYLKWLRLLIDANQIMVRVWGGGTYEDNFFYDTCDRLGILVWQDFMFACGNYPAHPSFLASIKDEAIANARRLRRHPSLVIFAGNNEDYQVQESENLTYDPAETNPENWLKTDFPARYIYEKLLPEVVAAEAPAIAYVPGSPFSRPGIPSPDGTIGDIHQWNVWHGTQSPYQLYPTLWGRFVSEFGMEAFPALSTLREFAKAEHDLHPQSSVMDFHNKAAGSTRRLASYVFENFRVGPTASLKDWVFLTQLLQAEALAYAYKGWRRRWGTPAARRVGGALVWQLNDCWPGISWSIADYYGRRKAAYYAVKRHLAPLTVGVLREHWDWSDGHTVIPKKLGWNCWVANGTLQRLKAKVQVRFVSVATGKHVKEPVERDGIVVDANSTAEIINGEVDNENEEQNVLVTKLWIDEQLVAVDCDWPQPLKYLDLTERGVGLSQKWNGRTLSLTITAKKPVKGFVFEETDGLLFSDNGFDVIPDEGVTVDIEGLKDGQAIPNWTYLGR